MTLIALLIGFAAALMLLIGGYLLGVKRGSGAREDLRRENARQLQEIQALRKNEVQTEAEREESLRLTIERALAPYFQRESLAIALSDLKKASGKRSDLSSLLDQIAVTGGFLSVVLGDADGLALAANSAAQDADRVAANSSLLLLTMDRISEQPAFAVSIMIRNEVGTTLCRIFNVQGQRVTLTAIAAGEGRYTPSALDPALANVAWALTGPFDSEAARG
jgi:hypothetical protein